MTGIVIPMAETGGVRAAAPRAIEDQTGRIVAEFGQRFAAIGDALETDRLDRELAKARGDISRELGAARLEMDAVGDPDAIEQGWPERTQALRDQVLSGVDPRNRARAELAFNELADSHALALGGRALDLRQSQYRATVADHADAVLANSATMDPGTRQAEFDQLTDNVTAAVKAGAMTPEDANSFLKRKREEMERLAASRALEDNPEQVLTDLEAGGYAQADPIWREGLRSTAKSAIAARDALAQAEAERAAKEAETAIDDRLEVMIGNAREGRVNAWEADFMRDPAVQARPKFLEAQATFDLRDALPGFASLPPAKQAEAIAAEKVKPVSERYETRLLKAMEEAHAASVAAWTADPVAAASKLGMSPPPPLPDGAAPAEMASAFAARRGYGLSLRQAGYVERPAFFSASERQSLAEATATTRDPAERAQLAASIVAGFGPEAPRALAEIGGDDVFAHMGGLAAAGGNAGLVAEAFKGQQMLDQKLVALPKAEDRRAWADSVLGDLFGDDPLAEGRILKSADAIYAAGARGVDPADGERAYMSAVQAAIGAGSTGRNGEQTGGVQSVRRSDTLLPIGVTAGQVEDGLDRAAERLEADSAGGGAIWQSVSASGGLPLYAGKPIDGETIGKVRLRAVGNDAYALFVERRGVAYDLTDSKTGAPYVMRLGRFLKEAAR